MRSRDQGADTEVARLLRRAGVGTYVSQREFARICGVSHETVSRLLRATDGDGQTRRPPTKATLDALAAGLGIPPAVFEAAVLSDYGYEQAVTGVAGVESVLAQLRDMSEADRRTVLAELAQEIATGGPRGPSVEHYRGDGHRDGDRDGHRDGHRRDGYRDLNQMGGTTDGSTTVRDSTTGS